jgi:uncharacterized RDD family membrane protein YckC
MPCTMHPAVLENLNPCSRCGKSYCPDCLVELKSNRFCAACKVEAVKDMQSGVTGTELPLATIGRRLAALMIDGLLQFVVWGPMFVFLMFSAIKAQASGASAAPVASGLQIMMQLVIAGVVFVYEGLFLQFKSATPGKMAMGLRVVSADGSPITAGQAWLRVFIRVLLAQLVFDCLIALFRKDRCAVHDMAARTRVIKVN